MPEEKNNQQTLCAGTSYGYYLRTAFISLGTPDCAAFIRGWCLIEEIRYARSHCRPLKLAAVSKVMPTAKVSLWRAFLTLLVWHAGGLDGEFVKLFRQKTAIGENVYL